MSIFRKKIRPLEKIESKCYRRIAKIVTFFVIPLLLYMSIQTFYFLANPNFRKEPYILSHILGYIILVIVFSFFTTLFKTTKRTTIFLSIASFIFLYIQQIKIGYSQDPILFSDFLFLSDTGSIFDIAGGTMFDMILAILPDALLLMVFLIVTIILSTIFEVQIYSKKHRIVAGIIGFSLIFVLYYPNNMVTVFMQNVFFDAVKAEKDNHTTTNIAYYQKNGVIGGMYGQLLANRFIEPEMYDEYEPKLDSIMKNEGDEYNKKIEKDRNWGTPNIIVVFSESFWDISKLDEVKFDKEVTSNFNRLKDKGVYAEMISPSFGGISCNIEYEMFTGSNIGMFCEGYIPYMQLMNNSNFYDAPYSTKVLQDNGYKIKIASTWSSTLFNCGRAYDYMNVDETMYSKDFINPDQKGGRISEKAVVDNIIKDLKNKKKGEKLFHMSLTAQTHMPYYLSRYKNDEYDIHVTDSPLPKDLQEKIQCYAQGVYDADKELGRLHEFIQGYDEPTIIIFYGDHLPYLQNETGDDSYMILDYFSGNDELTNNFRKYNTQLLITGNFELGSDDINYIGPDLIMPYVFGRCNFEKESDYYNYLNSTVHTLPAFNCFAAVDQDGKLYYPEDLTGDMKKVYDIRKCINWREYTNR